MSNFRPVDRDTSFLLPPSVDDWLPKDHLARFVIEIVKQLDLSALTLQLPEFLREARPNREQMRLVTHALAGPALRGGELSDVSPTSDLSALARLAANWRSLVEEAAMTPAERDERRTGQKPFDFGKEGRK